MSYEAIIKGGGKVYLDDYSELVKNMDLAKYEEKFRNNPGSWQVDQLDDPFGDLLMFGCSVEEMGVKLMELGVDLSLYRKLRFTKEAGNTCLANICLHGYVRRQHDKTIRYFLCIFQGAFGLPFFVF